MLRALLARRVLLVLRVRLVLMELPDRLVLRAQRVPRELVDRA